MPHPMTDEVRYRLLKFVADHPEASQREVARVLGVSLGKANYCLNALIGKGLVKIRNFARSQNKGGYVYVLTGRGLREKANVTRAFFHMKMKEYDELIEEIRTLRGEVGELPEHSAAIAEETQ